MASSTDVLIDYSLLISQLSRSKLQATNPPAHQTISSLIGGVKAFQDFANTTFASQSQNFDQLSQELDQLKKDLTAALEANVIYLYEVDCSGGPVTIDLSDPNVWNQMGWLIIKDYLGFCFTNPITLLGNVDGTDNPIFYQDYIKIHIYLSPTDGLYKTW